jgi:hypothetical protein
VAKTDDAANDRKEPALQYALLAMRIDIHFHAMYCCTADMLYLRSRACGVLQYRLDEQVADVMKFQ